MSPVTNSGFPIATIRMSARRVTALISRVREWHTVTVALPPGPSCSSRAAMGRPTMLDRPTITACLPVVSLPLRTSSCCTPNGVAGRNPVGSPIDTLPPFSGWKPSTSLAAARPGVTPRLARARSTPASSARIARPGAVPSISLPGKVHRAGLADADDLELPGLLQLTLDLARDLVGELAGLAVVDRAGRHHH